MHTNTRNGFQSNRRTSQFASVRTGAHLGTVVAVTAMPRLSEGAAGMPGPRPHSRSSAVIAPGAPVGLFGGLLGRCLARSHGSAHLHHNVLRRHRARRVGDGTLVAR